MNDYPPGDFRAGDDDGTDYGAGPIVRHAHARGTGALRAARGELEGMSCHPIGATTLSPGLRCRLEYSPQRSMRGPYLLTFAYTGGPGVCRIIALQFAQETLLQGAAPVDGRSFMRSVVLPNGESDWAPILLDGPALTIGNRLFVEVENVGAAPLPISVTLFARTIESYERALQEGNHGAVANELARLTSENADLRRTLRESDRGYNEWRAAAEAATAETRMVRAQHAAELGAISDPAFIARARDAVATLEQLGPSDPFEPGEAWETPSDES